MHLSKLSGSHVVLAMLLLGASSAGAQEAGEPAAAALAGSWTYVVPTSDPVGDAIERGIADMNFVTRPIARRRLRSTTAPYRTIRVEIDRSAVATAYDGRDAIRSALDGRPVRWRREDGELLNLTTVLRDGALIQTFIAEDGSRENALSVSADGRRLTLEVTIRSDRLPEPIVYRLAYQRAR